MNIVDESFIEKEEKKKSNAIKIVVTLIVITILAIIGIGGYIFYAEAKTLKVYVNGKQDNELKSMLDFKDNTIYLPIKKSAEKFGFQAFNGEDMNKTEEKNKCFIENENEIVNFEFQSNKIYRKDLSKTEENEYEYYIGEKKVESNGGELYASVDLAEKAFNMTFEYDKSNNRIYIYTLDYLYSRLQPKVLDYGYQKINDEYNNLKSIVEGYIIVEKTDEILGVINDQGETILEPKYQNITYIPYTGDFLVEDNGKVGIIEKNKKTKIKIMYDSIKFMDYETGLYAVEKDGKFGVVNLRGETIIYAENDEIGIDASKYKENAIKNKYIIANNIIPVRKNDKWALYNKSGTPLTQYIYEEIGYISKNNKDSFNLLVIPDYNVIVAKRNGKYTLLSNSAHEIFAPVADDIYMTIDGGKRKYFIFVNDKKLDAIDYLNKLSPEQREGITIKNNNTKKEEKTENKPNTETEQKNQNQNQNTNQNPNQKPNQNPNQKPNVNKNPNKKTDANPNKKTSVQ